MGNRFGGNWTEIKLKCIDDYLQAYVKILSKTPYRFAYIDAFAGTGYRQIKDEGTDQPSFPELIDDEAESFLSGSVHRALHVKPPFDKYFFIELDPIKCTELEKIKKSYPDLRIDIINDDANQYLSNLCKSNWSKNRAVLFLDPFGMQVKWSTIESIANTQAIDMWILFPLGIGVSRLLKKDGQIKPAWKNKLDDIFGSSDWFDEFYELTTEDNLFGSEQRVKKNVDFDKISNYFVKRLKTIFPKVSENPAKLLNSKNNPMFVLCFASGNLQGSDTAVKIADYLLKRI